MDKLQCNKFIITDDNGTDYEIDGSSDANAADNFALKYNKDYNFMGSGADFLIEDLETGKLRRYCIRQAAYLRGSPRISYTIEFLMDIKIKPSRKEIDER